MTEIETQTEHKDHFINLVLIQFYRDNE